MSQLTDKIKKQIEDLSKQAERLSYAGRGLILKVSEEGSRQLEELAKEGETQLESGNNLTAQLKDAVKIENGSKEVVSRWKLAAWGLVEKAKTESQKVIDDLVKEAEGKKAAKTTKPKAVKKSTKTAKAA